MGGKLVRRRAKVDDLYGLIQDVYPFEMPLWFDQARFYQFLTSIDFRWHSDSTFSTNTLFKEPTVKNVLDWIFDEKVEIKSETDEVRREFDLCDCSNCTQGVLPLDRQYYKLSSDVDRKYTVPIELHVRMGKRRLRKLSVVHPRSALRAARFLNQYAGEILYYTSRSRFSLRRPVSRTTNAYYRTTASQHRSESEPRKVELADENYQTASSFFTYKRYVNIVQFHKGQLFADLQQRYTLLRKLDIQSCFASIYTHSIAWACYGKKATKDSLRTVKDSFGGTFDTLMQSLNYNETNGIVIGPEISRIFAEIILQAVDVAVERTLRKEGKHLQLGKDYDIRRYVDDYFIFANSHDDLDLISHTLESELRQFALRENEGKRETVELPLISELAVARAAIARLLVSAEVEFDSVADCRIELRSFVQLTSDLLLDFQRIVVTTQVDPADVNGTLIKRVNRATRTFNWFIRDVEEEFGHSEYVKFIEDNIALIVQCYSNLTDAAFRSIKHGVRVNSVLEAVHVVAAVFYHLNHTEEGISDSSSRARIAAAVSVLKARVIKYVERLYLSGSLELGVGTERLIYLDTLAFLHGKERVATIEHLLTESHIDIESLDAIDLLSLLRLYKDEDSNSDVQNRILERIKAILQSKDQETAASRAYLGLSLYTFPRLQEVFVSRKWLGPEYLQAAKEMLRFDAPCSFMSWEDDAALIKRLLYKKPRMLY